MQLKIEREALKKETDEASARTASTSSRKELAELEEEAQALIDQAGRPRREARAAPTKSSRKQLDEARSELEDRPAPRATSRKRASLPMA